MRLLTVVVSTLFVVEIVSSIGISEKLDFGGNHGSSPKQFVKTKTIRRKAISSTTTDDGIISNEFNGIVCVSGGCNRTKTEEGASQISTEVEVKVKTNVNLEEKTVKEVEDTPDVPILIGTDSKSSIDRAFNVVPLQPEPIPDFKTSFYYNSPGVISTEATPQFKPSFYYNSQEPVSIGGIISTQPTPQLKPSFYYNSQEPVNIPRTYSKNPPIYSPSTQNFGDHSTGWFYPRRPSSSSIHNPVEFKNYDKPLWNQPSWSKTRPLHQTFFANIPQPNEMVCTCGRTGHGRTSSPNLFVHGTVQEKPFKFGQRDPGSQINDKLAPLV